MLLGLPVGPRSHGANGQHLQVSTVKITPHWCGSSSDKCFPGGFGGKGGSGGGHGRACPPGPRPCSDAGFGLTPAYERKHPPVTKMTMEEFAVEEEVIKGICRRQTTLLSPTTSGRGHSCWGTAIWAIWDATLRHSDVQRAPRASWTAPRHLWAGKEPYLDCIVLL